jgi:hypothetical protein
MLVWLTAAIFLASLVEELRKPAAERRWHGRVFGFIPYDYRPPSWERITAAWWNPNDDRVFTPRALGIGWAVNLHRVYTLVCRNDRAGSSSVDRPDSRCS